MKNNLNKKRTAIILASSLLLVGLFQNCSPAEFAATQKLHNADDNGILGNDDDIDVPAPEIVDNGPDETSEEVAQPSPTPPPVDSEIPDTELAAVDSRCSAVSSKIVMKDVDASGAKDHKATSFDGILNLDLAKDVSFTRFTGELVVKASESFRATSYRGSGMIVTRALKLTSYAPLKDTDVFNVNAQTIVGMTNTKGTLELVADRIDGMTSHSGNLCIHSPSLDSLTRVSGVTVLNGALVNGKRAQLKSITSVEGILILRNFDIGSITSINSAKIVLDNSSIGKITSFDGVAYLRNSSVPAGKGKVINY